VEDQLRKGYIRPFKSPQTSPVFFVGKKDGSKRMVMDYQSLNSQTVMNIEWDYTYYQPWSDNEWLVDEMLAMLDEDVTMQ